MPGRAVTVIAPLVLVAQLTFVGIALIIVGPLGELITSVAVAVQAFASVTVTAAGLRLLLEESLLCSLCHSFSWVHGLPL